MKKLEKILKVVSDILYVVIGIPFVIISILVISDIFKK